MVHSPAFSNRQGSCRAIPCGLGLSVCRAPMAVHPGHAGHSPVVHFNCRTCGQYFGHRHTVLDRLDMGQKEDCK